MKKCYNELEIMELMRNIEYGWVDKNKKRHNVVDNEYSDSYRLQSPDEVIKNKVGVCWDQTELERYYFEKSDLEIKTYFLVHYDNNKCPTHTFLVFKKATQSSNQYCWFEHAWEKFRGIHDYDSLKALLRDVKDKFIKYELNNHYDETAIRLYVYQKPKFHISTQSFYSHCELGERINVEEL